MAQINEAWRVLSDPARRAVYDARSPSSSTVGSAASQHGSTRVDVRASNRPTIRPDTVPPVVTPARFPWRLMVVVAALGIAFVLVNAALTRPGEQPVPDNLMEVGSCVDILDNGDAKEVVCNGAERRRRCRPTPGATRSALWEPNCTETCRGWATSACGRQRADVVPDQLIRCARRGLTFTDRPASR